MRRLVVGMIATVAVLGAACGSGDTTNAGGGEVRTVLVDYQHDEFASAFLRYYPEKVTVRPGDTVRFKQQWTGEPHSVTMGVVVDDMFRYQELFEKYDSPEAALADGVSQETIDDVLATFTRIPGMIGEEDEVYQPGARPCYVGDKEDVPMFTTPDEEINPDADCPNTSRKPPAFDGQALYNSGFIPYAGDDGNVFEVQLADDLEPGTYNYFCNYHWTTMAGQIEVVSPAAEIPSQSAVTSQARREIQRDAEEPLKKVRDARKTARGGSRIGNLEYPLAGREGDDEFKVVINEFLPKNATAQVGEPVTWTFDGYPHTVSFKVPKYFPLFDIRDDGTVYRNPKAYEPVGVKVPEREGDPFEDEDASIEVDGGRWNGGGGFLSSGALFPGDKFTMTFTKPGTYPYACVLHPQMVGTVEVRD